VLRCSTVELEVSGAHPTHIGTLGRTLRIIRFGSVRIIAVAADIFLSARCQAAGFTHLVNAESAR